MIDEVGGGDSGWVQKGGIRMDVVLFVNNLSLPLPPRHLMLSVHNDIIDRREHIEKGYEYVHGQS